MEIKSIMSKSIVSALPDTSIFNVAKMLSEHKIHGIPVVEGKKLVGIITETDFFTKDDSKIHLPTYAKVLQKKGFLKSIFQKKDDFDEKALVAKAKDIMTTNCVTISPEAKIEDFVALIKEKELHTIPVVFKGDLVGIVTVADILKLI
jgi:CBS domain-containing protein